jgi:hypothetical protein
MDFSTLSYVFALAVTIHNLEEAWLMPAWSKNSGRWHPAVGPAEFRFAVVVLTLLVYVCVFLAVREGKESLGAYLVTGSAIVMLFNVVFPHLAATLVMRRYAPGTATALIGNLPVTLLLLQAALQENYVHLPKMLWSGALIALVVMGMIPALFLLGRRLFPQQ